MNLRPLECVKTLPEFLKREKKKIIIQIFTGTERALIKMLTNSASSVVKHETGFSVQDQIPSKVLLHISNIKIHTLVNSTGTGRGWPSL